MSPCPGLMSWLIKRTIQEPGIKKGSLKEPINLSCNSTSVPRMFLSRYHRWCGSPISREDAIRHSAEISVTFSRTYASMYSGYGDADIPRMTSPYASRAAACQVRFPGGYEFGSSSGSRVLVVVVEYHYSRQPTGRTVDQNPWIGATIYTSKMYVQ